MSKESHINIISSLAIANIKPTSYNMFMSHPLYYYYYYYYYLLNYFAEISQFMAFMFITERANDINFVQKN